MFVLLHAVCDQWLKLVFWRRMTGVQILILKIISSLAFENLYES
jgi:hypothetical protein